MAKYGYGVKSVKGDRRWNWYPCHMPTRLDAAMECIHELDHMGRPLYTQMTIRGIKVPFTRRRVKPDTPRRIFGGPII